jgi:4-hydroxysphinganine ceramide fatty acyl 2-hydroxylase
MTVSKRVRIVTAEDLAQHNNASSCWVSRHGKVYDVTSFLADHPGGDELVLQWAGKDVDAVMGDKAEHEHSDAAYDVLEEFYVARLGSGEQLVSDDWVATDDFNPEDTDLGSDFEKNEFLDLRKPLMPQMWNCNFSKSYYLHQVHQPRHTGKESARLFGPDYLEVFTRTKWWVVPLFWGPITTYLGLRGLLQFTLGTASVTPFRENPWLPLAGLKYVTPLALAQTGASFALGCVVWTLLEYALHRFLFHLDYYLPDRPVFLMLHFLLHGIHHYLPMDRLRLVMPPVLFATLQFPFTSLVQSTFPTAMANAGISGAFAFYILYDCMHYALHHTKLPQYMREMKKYHLAHHYKNFDLAFGVTSKLWDYVFNTVLEV